MNARQRRRHVRAVKLTTHPEARLWVTFVIARRDRLLRRARRYASGSRALLRNIQLRRKFAVHPDVSRWKASQWRRQYDAEATIPRQYWYQHRTLTGRVAFEKPHHEERDRKLFPFHDIPRTPARPSLRDVIAGNDAEHNLVVEPAVYYDLVGRHPLAPPGTPFPAPVITRNLDTLAEDIRNAAIVAVDVPDPTPNNAHLSDLQKP